MGLVNPFKFCLVSVLSLLTLPLALLAGLTTFLAFSVLLVRISLFYVDFLVSFLPTYIFGRHTYSRRLRAAKPSPILAPSPALSSTSPYARRRARRPSAASPISADAFTPAAAQHGLGLMATPGMDRDFEGLGGWRDGEGDDDERWMNINSRFRIEGPVAPGQNHFRTLSGGRISRAAEYDSASRSPGSSTPVSPNTSKVRRPQPNLAPPPFTAVGRDRFL